MNFKKSSSIQWIHATREDHYGYKRLIFHNFVFLGMQDSEGSFEVISLSTLPQDLVTNVGAPAQIWQWFKSPADDDRLFYNVLWVNKTATRMPEVGSSHQQDPKSACSRAY